MNKNSVLIVFVNISRNIKPSLHEIKNAEASAQNVPQHNNPDKFFVDLNNVELLQTFKELKDEHQTVKQDNQRILELNEYLLDRMNSQEKDKRSAVETNSKTMTYKPKGKREKYSNSET